MQKRSKCLVLLLYNIYLAAFSIEEPYKKVLTEKYIVEILYTKFTIGSVLSAIHANLRPAKISICAKYTDFELFSCVQASTFLPNFALTRN